MKLAVIILNWNRAKKTLQAIHEVSEWRRISPSIWVVDNASKDHDGERIKQHFPNIHCLQSKVNAGFACGNNLALREILAQDFDCVLLLNNDASITEDNVLKLCESLGTNNRLGVVGPLLHEEINRNTYISAGGKDIAYHVHSRRQINERELPNLNAKGDLLSVDYVPGTAALIKTELFRKIGLLDGDYFFSGEIADFCERTKQQGYSCAIHLKSAAFHNTEPNSDLRKTLYLYYSLRNRFLFIRKFRKKQRSYLYTLWVFYGLLIGIQALGLFRFKRSRAAGLALIHGLRGRFGNQNDKFIK